MVEFHLGMVLSIYRGSVSKNKTTDRRMTISKPLPTAAPASLVAKLRVVQMEKLESTTMVASGLSPQALVSVEDVCGEVAALEEGVQNGILYIKFHQASLDILTGLQNNTLIFGKEQPKNKRRKKNAEVEEEFQGFNYKSFVKGDAGEANIENLGFVFVIC